MTRVVTLTDTLFRVIRAGTVEDADYIDLINDRVELLKPALAGLRLPKLSEQPCIYRGRGMVEPLGTYAKPDTEGIFYQSPFQGQPKRPLLGSVTTKFCRLDRAGNWSVIWVSTERSSGDDGRIWDNFISVSEMTFEGADDIALELGISPKALWQHLENVARELHVAVQMMSHRLQDAISAMTLHDQLLNNLDT